jgi:hypothetical protein
MNEKLYTSLPDGVIAVMAYLFVLGMGSLGWGMALLIVAIPDTLSLGSYFHNQALIIGMMSLFSILLGITMLFAMWLLWHYVAKGRVLTMLIASSMMIMCALSLPVLLTSGSSKTMSFPLAVAVMIGICSAAVWRTLQQAPIRALYSRKQYH